MNLSDLLANRLLLGTQPKHALERAVGCDLVQGYFFAKPMPAADFEAWLRDDRLAA